MTPSGDHGLAQPLTFVHLLPEVLVSRWREIRIEPKGLQKTLGQAS